MEFDPGKSLKQNILDLVNDVNQTALTEDQVEISTPVALDAGDVSGLNSTVTLTGTGTKYSGSVDIKYNRLDINHFAANQNNQVTVNRIPKNEELVSIISEALGILNGQTTSNATYTGGASQSVTLVSQDGSLAYYGQSTINMIIDPWTTNLTSMGSGLERYWHSQVVYNGKLYVFGGYDSSDNTLGDLWCYDPTDDSWTQLTSGATPRYGHSAAVINDTMYIFGGNKLPRLNDLWAYDLVNDSWAEISTTGGPGVRTAHKATAAGGLMYIFGGYNNGRLNDFWSYDPVANNWTELNNGGLTARSDYGMDVKSGHVYIFGGTADAGVLGDLWEYEIATDTWTNLDNDNSIARRYLTFSAETDADPFLYIFGGQDDNNNYLSDIHRYDLDKKEWLALPATGQNRAYHTSNMIQNELYSFGGKASSNSTLDSIIKISL